MSIDKRGLQVSLSLLLLSTFAFSQNASRPAHPQKPTVQVQSTSVPIIHQGVAVTLKVPDFEAARQQVISTALAHGGSVADAKVNVSQKGAKSGWLRLVVPANQINAVLPDIYGLGKLYGDKMLTSNDTSLYETLARRMDQLDKHQSRLSNVLEQPRRMRGSDILYLQERLYRAGLDHESLAQERLDLTRNAGSASVVLTMFEPTVVPPPPQVPHTVGEHVAATFSDAWVSFRRLGLRITNDIAYLVVYAAIWLPILLLVRISAEPLYRKMRALFARLVQKLTPA